MQKSFPDWSRQEGGIVAYLEERVATLTGMSAALFVPSGTMANTLAMCVAARPGGALISDQAAHVLRAEGEAYARIARLVPYSVNGPRGHPTATQVSALLVGDPESDLVWLENTHTFAGGTVAPTVRQQDVIGMAAEAGMRVHLDGARLWNAAVALGEPLDGLVGRAHSVTLNLDKGLGCPAGSILCGSDAFIEEARRWRTALGGLIAQPAMIAAGALVALDDFESVLARDHSLASKLAAGLRQTGLVVEDPETNIVLVHVADAVAALHALARVGVLAFSRDPTTIRLVTHRDISHEDVERVIEVSRCLHAA